DRAMMAERIVFMIIPLGFSCLRAFVAHNVYVAHRTASNRCFHAPVTNMQRATFQGEGIVCKRKDSAYQSGARSGWVKMKTEQWKAANQYRLKFNAGPAIPVRSDARSRGAALAKRIISEVDVALLVRRAKTKRDRVLLEVLLPEVCVSASSPP